MTSIRRGALALLVTLCGGCSGSAAPDAPAKQAASEAEVDVEPPAASGRATLDAKTLCETPCLLLTTHAFEELGRTEDWCRLCGAHDAHACAGAISPLSAPYLCEAADHARSCIYAAHGYPFREAQWKAAFEARPWYTRRDDFQESELSTLELANVRALMQLEATCASGLIADASTITTPDLKVVLAWIDESHHGTAPLPPRRFWRGKPTTERVLRRELSSEAGFLFEADTPISYVTGTVGETGFPEGATRTVRVDTGTSRYCNDPDPLAINEQCGRRHEWIELTLDAWGRIVALHLDAGEGGQP